jgi:hypothetical protein
VLSNINKNVLDILLLVVHSVRWWIIFSLSCTHWPVYCAVVKRGSYWFVMIRNVPSRIHIYGHRWNRVGGRNSLLMVTWRRTCCKFV